jgi:hypothetical protein
MQLKCREGQRNLPVAALEDGDDNWPALLLSVTAFCLLLCFSFPCSVVFFFFVSVCSPASRLPRSSAAVCVCSSRPPVLSSLFHVSPQFFFLLCGLLLLIKPENGLSSRVRASRSWGTNASVSVRRNRGRKLAPLCTVSVLAFLFVGFFYLLSALLCFPLLFICCDWILGLNWRWV